ncbi:hypothetical protein PIB30_038824 [Stylosanthes scabra]|uniref:Uncharacterized protein n=1 Tax=Stylosanthes scabra TaxID=79078 RepID=A0ABU6SEC4_9FABA|nr:hypothetical protein [Stylosanthes scabra]
MSCDTNESIPQTQFDVKSSPSILRVLDDSTIISSAHDMDAEFDWQPRFVCAKEGLRGVDKRDLLIATPRLKTRTNCLPHSLLTSLTKKNPSSSNTRLRRQQQWIRRLECGIPAPERTIAEVEARKEITGYYGGLKGESVFP